MAAEITHRSWFSRILESIRGVVVGLFLIVGSFAGLWWNEGNAVRTARSLEEGQGKVVTIDPSNLDPAHEGKLVHLTAEATTVATLADDEFPGITTGALRLRRHVEMFQWIETKKTRQRDRTDGGTEKVVTPSYSMGWSSEPIDSNEFKFRGGENPMHNPPMTIRSRTQETDPVRLGAFLLPTRLVERIDAWEPLPVKVEDTGKRGFRPYNGLIYGGINPESPRLGEMKISFEIVNPTTVSLVAVQRGDSFEPYSAKAGKQIEILEQGTHSASDLFQSAQRSNEITTWVLRGLATLAMAIGIYLVFRPLAVIADVIPLFGDLLGAGLFLFATVIALAFSAVGIGVAWLSYRPTLGGGLLAAALVVLVGFKWFGRKTRRIKKAVLD